MFRRIRNNAHPCAPLGIPSRYDIVTDSGQILPGPANPYETPTQSEARAKAQETVWNTVWLRRIVYFLNVFASAGLLIFPLIKTLPASDEYSSPVRWLSDLIRLVGSFLPSIATPWLNGYARSPLTFAALALAVAGMSSIGSRLSLRIKSDMGAIWQRSVVAGCTVASTPETWTDRLRTSPPYEGAKRLWKFHLGPALSALFLVYAGMMVINHLLYIVIDDAGLVCSESRPTRMVKGETRQLTFDTSSVCSPTGILLDNGGDYLITIKARESQWLGRTIATTPSGFYSLDPSTIWERGAMLIALPMRRELIRPWFRIVARTGSVGGEESFLDPDPNDHSIEEVIRATRDGELFFFVNNSVIGLPGLAGIFYANNRGSADITVTRR